MICRDPLSKEKQNPDSVKSEIIILTNSSNEPKPNNILKSQIL